MAAGLPIFNAYLASNKDVQDNLKLIFISAICTMLSKAEQLLLLEEVLDEGARTRQACRRL